MAKHAYGYISVMNIINVADHILIGFKVHSIKGNSYLLTWIKLRSWIGSSYALGFEPIDITLLNGHSFKLSTINQSINR